MRYLYLSIGFIFLIGAFIGIVVPGIPTTPLILVAAWAFARSSKRFEAWLLQHRIFGPIISDWRTNGSIRRSNKIKAVVAIAITFAVTMIFAFSPFFDGIFAVFGALLCVYLITRPEPPVLLNKEKG
ncbi:MAG: hypothetical protein CL402_05815 [Acidiferrobacteraceae bacterium]|nr:hypothetical protein [Acidiferrobacteraceae bacterium]|tara:strand:+ start:63823 stop:64203 length:381 start_codon:yes stop_codon:yes gene_type:complete